MSMSLSWPTQIPEIRPCLTCGLVHEYSKSARSWASDHVYRPMSWETFARDLYGRTHSPKRGSAS